MGQIADERPLAIAAATRLLPIVGELINSARARAGLHEVFPITDPSNAGATRAGATQSGTIGSAAPVPGLLWDELRT